MWLLDMFLTMSRTLLFPFLRCVNAWRMWSPGGSSLASHNWPSPAFSGVIITWAISPKRGSTHSSMISVWNGPRQMLSLTVHLHPLLGAPTDLWLSFSSTPQGGDHHGLPTGKQLCHLCCGPGHREMAYLAFPDDINYSANCTGHYDQGHPMAKLRFIGYHKEHNILIVPGDLPYLHAQDNKPKWTCAFSTQPYKVQWVVD